MLTEISNTPRDYAWGSVHAIADLLGRDASGGPEAELWFGAHPVSPSSLVHPEPDGIERLNDLVRAHPETGDSDGRIPFLLKVLAAGSALSIQVHPSMDQAREGFARENAAGVALDSPSRNYRDASHKPELIFCLSDTFDALCGFRPVEQSMDALRAFIAEGTSAGLPVNKLNDLAAQLSASPLSVRDTVVALLGAPRESVAELVAQLCGVTAHTDASSAIARDASTVRMLSAEYAGDPGIVVAFLMNRLTLRRGEALFVPHGIMHAYLGGLGIEIMAESDNVLRGGLTTKHVDVTELVAVARFEPTHPEPFAPTELAAGVECFAPDVSEFALIHVSLTEAVTTATVNLDGPAIVLCTAGSAHLTGRLSTTAIARGQAFFVSPDEDNVTLEGNGEFFIARPGDHGINPTIG